MVGFKLAIYPTNSSIGCRDRRLQELTELRAQGPGQVVFGFTLAP